MASFTYTLAVAAPPARVWALVSDVQRVAALFPYTEVADLQAADDQCWLFWRELRLPNIADLRWRERACITAEGELSFTAVEGDVESMVGWWRVSADGDAAQLTLEMEYEVPPVLASFVPPILAQYVVDELFKTICRRVKEAAEEDER